MSNKKCSNCDLAKVFSNKIDHYDEFEPKNCGNCKHAGIYPDNDMTDYLCDNLKSKKHYSVNKTDYCDNWEAKNG